MPVRFNAVVNGDRIKQALEALGRSERLHYERLLATTALLADISFADILVLLPAAPNAATEPPDFDGAVTPDRDGNPPPRSDSGPGSGNGDGNGDGNQPFDGRSDGHPHTATASPDRDSHPHTATASPDRDGRPYPGTASPDRDRRPQPDGDGAEFIVTAHSRPITSQTVHPDDLVGRRITPAERPLAAEALRTGVSTNGGAFLADQDFWVHSLAVPVNHDDRTIALLLREFPAVSHRVWGRLENSYFALFRRLAGMIADGVFPYATTPSEHDHPPRVGDGLILLDARRRVEYLSPNAHSALRRLGINDDPSGRHLAEVGIEPRAVRMAASTALPRTEEIERNGHSAVVRCLPLIQEDTLTGLLVLVRDITELRRADRLLITKNAALAEVHHRVKNNLQTVSSLLSLQSRWLENLEAKVALAESARRVQLIASVHEILTGPGGDGTPFENVVRSLSSLLRESLLAPHKPISIRVEGAVGPLPSEVTTTLAIVLNELVQNAVDHGFTANPAPAPTTVAPPTAPANGGTPTAARPDAAGTPPPATSIDRLDKSDDQPDDSHAAAPDADEIVIRIFRKDSELSVCVSDNGRAHLGNSGGPLPEGMGLTLVRTLVENDLGGTIVHSSSPAGTTVQLTAHLATPTPSPAPAAADTVPTTPNRQEPA